MVNLPGKKCYIFFLIIQIWFWFSMYVFIIHNNMQTTIPLTLQTSIGGEHDNDLLILDGRKIIVSSRYVYNKA